MKIKKMLQQPGYFQFKQFLCLDLAATWDAQYLSKYFRHLDFL